MSIPINQELLEAVAREVARGAPVAAYRDRIAKRFGVSARSVYSYAAMVHEERDREGLTELKSFRRNGMLTAQASAAKWMKRADRCYTSAAKLLARADRIDGKEGIGARLTARLLDLGVRLDDGDREQLQDPIDPGRAAAALEVAREDRRQAAILIREATRCEARAADWFDRAAKICGAYEIAPVDEKDSRALLTSPERRAKLDRLRELLADAKRRGTTGNDLQ